MKLLKENLKTWHLFIISGIILIATGLIGHTLTKEWTVYIETNQDTELIVKDGFESINDAEFWAKVKSKNLIRYDTLVLDVYIVGDIFPIPISVNIDE